MNQNSKWLNSTVIYQIYPRSFKDTNGDGIGDIRGIIEKLDYLNDGTENSLGVDAIWLSPIYPSPMADFGYDIADFCNIDSIYGNLEDFDELIKECKKRNIKVILDYVPNHTSSEHPWFIESRSSRTNAKRDWYIWKDPQPDGSPPNNWLSVFGGSAWELDEKTGQYYYHAFDKMQPDLNWRNEEVIQSMLEVFIFWKKRGVTGFRVDALEWMFERFEHGDEPVNPNYHLQVVQDPYQQLLHTHTFALPECVDIIKRFTDTLNRYPDNFLVTEIWSPVEELLKMYPAIGKDWFMPFNFSLIMLPWKVAVHKEFIDQFDEAVGHLYQPTYVLGNHDKPRVSSRIGKEQTRVAALLQFTLRGIPFIYYGEEIGMENGDIPPDRIVDPMELNNPGIGIGRDPQRTPMQWDDSAYAGFTSQEPWLPLHIEYKHLNVKAQKKDPQSLFSLYRKLIHFRKNSLPLQVGKYNSWDNENEGVFTFTRQHESETLLIALNYTEDPQTIKLPFSTGKILIDTNLEDEGKEVNCSHFILPSNSGYIIQL